jgi:hypothetical protein
MTIYRPGFETDAPPTEQEMAIEWAKRFLSVAGGEESEIRQMHDDPAK